MSWRQAGTSGRRPWRGGSRLKEVTLDPLEAVGFPSKGDNSLLDPDRQKKYYATIAERYKKLESTNNHNVDELINKLSLKDHQHGQGAAQTEEGTMAPINLEPKLVAVEEKHRNELATIIEAMRKFREAIMASRRTDSFALASYTFIIRATILTGRWEAYQPALLHLLRYLLPVEPRNTALSNSRQEFVGYLILDLACRQDDLAEAHKVRHTSHYADKTVNGLLRAITRHDWYSYWRFRARLDEYQRQLCGKVDERMRARALNCLEASYRPELPKKYVEAVAGRTFSDDELRDVKPNWEVKGDGIVVIKRAQKN